MDAWTPFVIIKEHYVDVLPIPPYPITMKGQLVIIWDAFFQTNIGYLQFHNNNK